MSVVRHILVVVAAFVAAFIAGCVLVVAAYLVGGEWGLVWLMVAILAGCGVVLGYRAWAKRERRKLADLIALSAPTEQLCGCGCDTWLPAGDR